MTDHVLSTLKKKSIFEKKLTFFGIFGVKTQWIIGQKSQNSARYVGAF